MFSVCESPLLGCSLALYQHVSCKHTYSSQQFVLKAFEFSSALPRRHALAGAMWHPESDHEARFDECPWRQGSKLNALPPWADFKKLVASTLRNIESSSSMSWASAPVEGNASSSASSAPAASSAASSPAASTAASSAASSPAAAAAAAHGEASAAQSDGRRHTLKRKRVGASASVSTSRSSNGTKKEGSKHTRRFMRLAAAVLVDDRLTARAMARQYYMGPEKDALTAATEL